MIATSTKNMSGIFIDTGAWVARYHGSDQYHRQAVLRWDAIKRDKRVCWTSNMVLNETLTLLSRRIGYSFAAERARAIYLGEALSILRPNEDDEMNALSLMEKFSDQGIGFTDCISFVLMKKKRVSTAFSFDRHFELAGFQLFTP